MEITKEEEKMFRNICDQMIGVEKTRVGIGTLGEKTIHVVLKHYLVPRTEYHEIKCNGFIADIMIDGEIIEIQTANFNVLRKKLEVYLFEYEVTIVYPIPAIKWLIWINQETGELTNRRKSNKKGRIGHIFPELYKIKTFLSNPRLHLRIIMLEVEEYRLLSGWSLDRKKGSTRFDRIPLRIMEDIMIDTVEEYKQFLPDSLPQQFISKEFSKSSGLSTKQVQCALNVLTYVGILEKIGKQGRSILYQIKEQKENSDEKIRRKGIE